MRRLCRRFCISTKRTMRACRTDAGDFQRPSREISLGIDHIPLIADTAKPVGNHNERTIQKGWFFFIGGEVDLSLAIWRAKSTGHISPCFLGSIGSNPCIFQSRTAGFPWCGNRRTGFAFSPSCAAPPRSSPPDTALYGIPGRWPRC